MKSDLSILPSPAGTTVTVDYKPLAMFIDLWSDTLLFQEDVLRQAMSMWREAVMNPKGKPVFSRQDKRGVFDKMTIHVQFCSEEDYLEFLDYIKEAVKDVKSYKTVEQAMAEDAAEQEKQNSIRANMLKQATEGTLDENFDPSNIGPEEGLAADEVIDPEKE